MTNNNKTPTVHPPVSHVISSAAASFFVLLGVTACAVNKPIDPIPTHGTIQRSITWVLTDEPGKACDYALGKPLIGHYNACARLRGNECIIYVKPPRNEDDRNAIYVLGHEALHCFVGNFHNAVN